MGHKLVMRFTTEIGGKYFTLSLNNMKSDDATGLSAVTEAQVNTMMNLIIRKGIFLSAYGALASKKMPRFHPKLHRNSA